MGSLNKPEQVSTQTVLQRTSTVRPVVSIPCLCYEPPIEEIKHKFPYFDELDQIWWGIPGFDSELISSDPAVDHSQGMLSLTRTKNTSSVQVEEEGLNNGALDDLDDEHDDPDGLGEIEEGDPGAESVDMQVDDAGWQAGSFFDLDDDPMVLDDADFPSSAAVPSNQVSMNHIRCCFDCNKIS